MSVSVGVNHMLLTWDFFDDENNVNTSGKGCRHVFELMIDDLEAREILSCILFFYKSWMLFDSVLQQCFDYYLLCPEKKGRKKGNDRILEWWNVQNGR